jgi:hypothetical protein
VLAYQPVQGIVGAGVGDAGLVVRNPGHVPGRAVSVAFVDDRGRCGILGKDGYQPGGAGVVAVDALGAVAEIDAADLARGPVAVQLGELVVDGGPADAKRPLLR